MTDQKRIELANKITKAFKNAQIPKGDIGDKDELVGFNGKRWQDVTLEAIEYNDALYFFSARGFQYYLPAYLVMILNSPEKISTIKQDMVIRDLGASVVMHFDMCKLFDAKQISLIVEFLHLQSYEAIHGNQTHSSSNPNTDRLVKKWEMEFNEMLQRAINYWGNC